ncbi:MAG TPA: hypothetical protein VFF52_04060 [Isosphaeraceae bacterium]|nr:hypothetical protein [Isosphaeraceae bacterium]
MFQNRRSPRRRQLHPSVDPLEGRALLNAAMPHHAPEHRVPAHVFDAKTHGSQPNTSSSNVTLLNAVNSHGYEFLNLDGPTPGTNAATGTNLNGISNGGTSVGFTIDNQMNLLNFTTNPLRSKTANVLNINGSMKAMALGVNSAGTVVGTDGNGNAFSLSRRGVLKTFIPNGGMSATAFGINDQGTIVGQYVTSTATPGFIQVNGKSSLTINAPSGPNTVNPQGINNKGLVVGFYVGTDGQFHGFDLNVKAARNGVLTGTPVADPTIPTVAGEPGATFVFSQILGVNDKGIAVGYYGDSTLSQHGFLYNVKTKQYTFLDDPSEAFNNGVEVTQITGITNSGELTGFYSDANGVFHGFVAIPRRR